MDMLTPGPWKAKHYSVDAGDVPVALSPGQFYVLNSSPWKRWRANARLIAAAPDYHAVALELHRLSLVIESAVRNADPVLRDDVAALISANRAAVAKVEGTT